MAGQWRLTEYRGWASGALSLLSIEGGPGSISATRGLVFMCLLNMSVCLDIHL